MRERAGRPTPPLVDPSVYPHSGVNRSVYPHPLDRPVCLPRARVPPALGIEAHGAPRLTVCVTTTEATRADLLLTELHEHLSAIERLAHAPFNSERIALHKREARECLDALALTIDA